MIPAGSGAVSIIQGGNTARVGTNPATLDPTVAQYLSVGGLVYVFDGTNMVRLLAAVEADAQAAFVQGVQVVNHPSLFNSSTWDRARNNYEETQFASAARTSTTNGPTSINYNARGMLCLLDVTAVSGTTPTLDVQFQFTTSLVASFFAIGDSANTNTQFNQVTAVTTTGVTFYPGIVEKLTGDGRRFSNPMWRQWRMRAVIGGTTPSFTFSASATYIL